MGRAKEMMIEHEANLAASARYLVSKDYLKQCEIHAVIYGGGWTLESEDWQKFMADRKRGSNGPIPWANELEAPEFTDLVKEAYEEHCADSCGRCDKVMAE